MHPAKRRRTNNDASALSKPFRSPLPVDLNKQKSSFEKQDDLKSQETIQATPVGLLPGTQVASNPPLTPTHLSTITSHSPTRPVQTRTLTHDSTYIALQKEYRALTLKLKDLSSSLDTATQALKILDSNKNDDLNRLIAKWRDVSRQAAEELFSTAKEQVNRMGGVGSWQEKNTKLREQASWGYSQEADEDDLTERQKENFAIAREEARHEAEKYGLYQERPVPESEVNDSFTIDMMLRQLNIDLEAIGYDVQAQQWID